jgi:hypothetical protein
VPDRSTSEQRNWVYPDVPIPKNGFGFPRSWEKMTLLYRDISVPFCAGFNVKTGMCVIRVTSAEWQSPGLQLQQGLLQRADQLCPLFGDWFRLRAGHCWNAVFVCCHVLNPNPVLLIWRISRPWRHLQTRRGLWLSTTVIIWKFLGPDTVFLAEIFQDLSHIFSAIFLESYLKTCLTQSLPHTLVPPYPLFKYPRFSPRPPPNG